VTLAIVTVDGVASALAAVWIVHLHCAKNASDFQLKSEIDLPDAAVRP
jgi:hypothetical protein